MPDFIEKHISVRNLGYYAGSYPDIAASYGYCLTMQEYHNVYEQAHYASRSMVLTSLFGVQPLNPYQQAAFDEGYEKGFMEGQSVVAKQLYNLATMGEYKAIDKFLEVRGAYGKEAVDTGPAVQVTLAAELKEVDGIVVDKQNVINFPAK